MPEFSLFSVDQKSATEVIKNLKGSNFKGQKVVIEKSQQMASYSHKRTRRPERSFKRKRRSR